MQHWALCVVLLLISSCASHGLNIKHVNRNITYPVALNNFEALKGQSVIWGGKIVAGKNLKNTTEIEILAFAQDSYDEPIKDSRSYGRFLAEHPGYLELGEYSKDRWVTLVGSLRAIRVAKVGESDYTYPVIHIEQIKLWPIETDYPESDFGIHFGFGTFHRF